MRKNLVISIAALLCLLLSGCEIETSGNGKLDGMWQLTDVSGVTYDGEPSGDMRDSGIYWAFQGDIVLLHNPDHPEVVGGFSVDGGVLTLGPLYINDREAGNPEVSGSGQLFPVKIYSYPWTFTIERLDGKTMQLYNNGVRLAFRKY